MEIFAGQIYTLTTCILPYSNLFGCCQIIHKPLIEMYAHVFLQLNHISSRFQFRFVDEQLTQSFLCSRMV